MTVKGKRLDARTRTKALEAGWWQQHDGTMIDLVRMPDPHLVNALLKAILESEPPKLVRLLSAEVVRRNLAPYATQIARERTEGARR